MYLHILYVHYIFFNKLNYLEITTFSLISFYYTHIITMVHLCIGDDLLLHGISSVVFVFDQCLLVYYELPVIQVYVVFRYVLCVKRLLIKKNKYKHIYYINFRVC